MGISVHMSGVSLLLNSLVCALVASQTLSASPERLDISIAFVSAVFGSTIGGDLLRFKPTSLLAAKAQIRSKYQEANERIKAGKVRQEDIDVAGAGFLFEMMPFHSVIGGGGGTDAIFLSGLLSLFIAAGFPPVIEFVRPFYSASISDRTLIYGIIAIATVISLLNSHIRFRKYSKLLQREQSKNQRVSY